MKCYDCDYNCKTCFIMKKHMNINHQTYQVKIVDEDSASEDDVFNNEEKDNSEEQVKTNRSFVFSEITLDKLDV